MKTLLCCFLIAMFSFTTHAQIIPEDMDAPSFDDLEWLSGGITSKDLAGKNVLLEFWTATCPPCIEAFEHINDLADAFGKDIVFVSVSLDKTRGRVEKFMKKTEFKTAVCIGDNDFRKAFGGQLIPRTVLIDKAGKVRWTGRPTQMKAGILRQFLDDNTVPVPRPPRELLSITVSESGPEADAYITGANISPPMYLWQNWDLASIVERTIARHQSNEALEFEWEGVKPLEPYLDVKIEMDSTKTVNSLFKPVLDVLQQSFGFSYRFEFITAPRVTMNIADMKKLAEAQQKDANDDDYSKEETESEIVFANVSLTSLHYFIAKTFDLKMLHGDRPYQIYPPGYFNIRFPWDDYSKAREYLFIHYGLELTEQDATVNKCIISYPGEQKDS